MMHEWRTYDKGKVRGGRKQNTVVVVVVVVVWFS